MWRDSADYPGPAGTTKRELAQPWLRGARGPLKIPASRGDRAVRSRQLRIIVACVVAVLVGAGALQLAKASGASVTVTLTARSATTLTIGSAFLWQVKTTNNSSTFQTLGNAYYLHFPDGTKLQVPPMPIFGSIGAGATTTTVQATTSSVYSSETGTFTFEADALSSTGAVLASSTVAFTILPLPATLIPPKFTDIAASAGVAAIHHDDPTDCMNSMGTGAGWADYDGDGHLDLFVSDYNGPSHLYHNNGNMTFTDVTAAAGIPTITRATGVTWADYDNDGYPDLLVLSYGTPHLFHNNRNGTFTDVSAAAGLTASGRFTSAAWGDFDSDGWLDLYLVSYGLCAKSQVIQENPSRLYHNNHNGVFSDFTNLLGGTSNKAVQGLGFAAAWLDFNNDNRPDLYVVNDMGATYVANVLWRNDGPNVKTGWTLTNVSSSSKANLAIFSMGIAIGDYNRDGYMDFGISNMAPNMLLANNGNGTFTQTQVDSGVQRDGVPDSALTMSLMSVTWGLGFVDLNNDGYEDLFIAGGDMNAVDDVPNAVLVNNINSHLTGLAQDGAFLDLTYASGANTPRTSRTVTFGDFDGDGWMDAVVVNFYNEATQLYRNVSGANGNTNNWLEVRLIGTTSNRDGIGAKLTLTAGSDTQCRQIFSGTSLGAGNMIPAHFGLASHTQADSLKVLWPSGLVQTFTNILANRRIVLTEGSSLVGTY